MVSPRTQLLFKVFAVLWVGGWGFIVYRHPEFFAKLNARFGAKWASGPRFISFTRKAGIVYMAMAVLSAVVMLVMKP
jgi:hypothetical protein